MTLTIARLDFDRFLVLETRLGKVSCSPATLMELKDAIRHTVGGIDADMPYAAVTGVVILLTCPIPCGGGPVENSVLLNECTMPCCCFCFSSVYVYLICIKRNSRTHGRPLTVFFGIILYTWQKNPMPP
ncbi:hypothetical protein CDAR_200101 [Caerostris darwini]|uniref:Uncharacterized protein n=1 Tax=Caerostris darwini TaxID=1538125 RepID=A0AAV4RQW1_9ARAC|nr:hypothetical protein CDAR_200101 [Caerostris darwini]